MASHDLRHILSGWPYEPGQITVRRIIGDDGKPRIQMRLDLGLLQMEIDGRPDGQRPNGFESLLEFQHDALERQVKQHGAEAGFELSPAECQALREEAAMYYHRYLALFVLEEFSDVERDTARNLAVLDLCHRYAAEDSDRWALEPYRVYLIMMHTRARAHQVVRRTGPRAALKLVERGLEDVRAYLASVDESEDFDDLPEVAVLRALRDELANRLPTDPARRLRAELESAIREERYEEAASLRDRLASMREGGDGV